MPARIIPIVTDEVYHVFNRGINHQPTFTSKREFERAVLTIKFYQVAKPPARLSKVLQLPKELKEDILKSLDEAEKLVEIISFCFMPNHFHFLLKQKKDGGIAKFVGNFQNSYTRYRNTKNESDGSIFLTQFKAIRIITDEQLIHVSRYIHLNPYTGYVVKSLAELKQYPWSSFKYFLSGRKEFINPDLVMGMFKDNKAYEQFVYDQADYQRELKSIKHLIIE